MPITPRYEVRPSLMSMPWCALLPRRSSASAHGPQIAPRTQHRGMERAQSMWRMDRPGRRRASGRGEPVLVAIDPGRRAWRADPAASVLRSGAGSGGHGGGGPGASVSATLDGFQATNGELGTLVGPLTDADWDKAEAPGAPGDSRCGTARAVGSVGARARHPCPALAPPGRRVRRISPVRLPTPPRSGQGFAPPPDRRQPGRSA